MPHHRAPMSHQSTLIVPFVIVHLQCKKKYSSATPDQYSLLKLDFTEDTYTPAALDEFYNFDPGCELRVVVKNRPNDFNGDVEFFLPDSQLFAVGLHPNKQQISVTSAMFPRGEELLDDVTAIYPASEGSREYSFRFTSTGIDVKAYSDNGSSTKLITIKYGEVMDDGFSNLVQTLSKLSRISFGIRTTEGQVDLHFAQDGCSQGLWIPVERDIKIPHELETTPIELKTDAVIGDENKTVDILFYDRVGSYIGQFYFGFTKPDYLIYSCQSQGFQADFPADASGVDTIISIKKTKNSDGTSYLAMFYDNVRVVNYELSNANCKEGYYNEVEMISFYTFDQGEKFYRIASGKKRKSQEILMALNVKGIETTNEYRTVAQVALAATYLLLTILALVGNICVFIINFRWRGGISNFKITSIFLLNLAVTDLGIAIGNLPFAFISICINRWIFGEAFCVVNGFIAIYLPTVSITTILIITVHRAMVVLHPFKTIVTKKVAYSACVFRSATYQLDLEPSCVNPTSRWDE
ncbi:hypothetical protein ACHWQZ_G001043 [Mnemiopsis leidyi]